MQDLGAVTTENLLQRGQQPLLKLEIFVDPNWINVSDWFSYILSACDATTDWTGTALSIDNADYKEGTGSLKDTIAAPVIDTGYATVYNPAGSWDWSAKKHILLWFKSDRANTAFTNARLMIWDTSNNYRYWNLTFSAGEWTAIKELLSTGDGESGTPPDLALINKVELYFLTADTTPFWKKIDHMRIDDSPVGQASGDFLESFSISFAGAEMSPNPIAATFSGEISNEGAIFHPKHPTSAYSDYFKAGRKVRMSVGAKYSETDYYWQRIIGHIDVPKFSGRPFKVSIGGLDYTKTLVDTLFSKTALPPDNYWGAVKTTDSKPSEGGLGSELYDEFDAMEIEHEDDNVDNWTPTNCAFVSVADGEAPSGTHVGQMTMVNPADFAVVKNTNVINANVTYGQKYKVKFHYKRLTGSSISVLIYQTVGGADRICGAKYNLSASSYTAKSIYFYPLKTGVIQIWIVYADLTNGQFRIDKISIKAETEYEWHQYQLPAACTGVHYAELDAGEGFEPVWPGKQKGEGWYYDPATRYFSFDEGKDIEAGTDNLKIYYYTEQVPENVVADLMFKAGLYVDQAAALAAMEYTATGKNIDQVWFEAGKSYLSAIKMLCERCDYRFYFKYDSTPVFKPFPTAKGAGSEDLVFEKQHISDPEYYEDRNEIRNRIVIEGLKQALPEGAEETVPSEWKGTAVDDDSIAAYGEHTLSIKNHLFQGQGSIDTMCAILLARYKDPMWYFDFDTPFNPAPLEIWDTIKAEFLLKTEAIPESGDTTVNIRGLIRDIKIDSHNITYKCEEVT